MEFNQKTHKVKFGTLKELEAKAYIRFLEDERVRHEGELKWAKQWCFRLFDMGGFWADAMFWDSAVARHEDDIRDIYKLIKKVKDKFKL